MGRKLNVVARLAAGLALGLTMMLPARAADADDELRYVELQPTFITNFGVSQNGHMMYVKADVAVRVATKSAEEATKYHLPALRDSIVMLLSAQEEAALVSGAGREEVRMQALSDLRAVLERETGEPQLSDLIFTNFIVQR